MIKTIKIMKKTPPVSMKLKLEGETNNFRHYSLHHQHKEIGDADIYLNTPYRGMAKIDWVGWEGNQYKLAKAFMRAFKNANPDIDMIWGYRVSGAKVNKLKKEHGKNLRNLPDEMFPVQTFDLPQTYLRTVKVKKK